MKQTIYLALFASFFGNLLNPLTVSAKTYAGRLEKATGHYYISRNSTRYELLFKDASFEPLMQKLKTKDFISLEGALASPSASRNKTLKVNVTEINYIGLNDLLGFWKDQTGYCHYFSGFTTLKKFFPVQPLDCNMKSLARAKNFVTNLNYFINPDSGDVWNLLISGDQDQYFAELIQLDSDTNKMILYNSYDGNLFTEDTLKREDF